MLSKLIRFFVVHPLVAGLLLLMLLSWGLIHSPFEWKLPALPSDPVPVDAIPDLGENQQIVFAEWPGRSPQDIEDQLTYPLTSALLGLPGVKTIRSTSMFGLSSIYVIFDEGVEFYWSRSRILEKLNALPANTLPQGVQPALGPDATGLGQVFWYTLEGRDAEGQITGGWDLQELRSIQDFYVKNGLLAAEGVAEVASIGGYQKEYQIDLNPAAMKLAGVSIAQVADAVRKSNLDIGAKTLEINRVEYFIRGIGTIRSLDDLRQTVVASRGHTAIKLQDIARVGEGPAIRRGALDKNGVEVAGGVVVARHGTNPLKVITHIKEKIAEIEAGMPKKTLADGRTSQVRIVPFYDRTELIHETIGTLAHALWLEILITILVIMMMLMNLRASLMVSGLLPLAVLGCFIAMKQFGVDANIVALSGIAIAIGTMVDIGIVLSENIVRHLQQAAPDTPKSEVIVSATMEVASAILTAVATTVVSFLPVFAMEGAEGKLFTPLAMTKTFALVASVVIALILIPVLSHQMLGRRKQNRRFGMVLQGGMLLLALVLIFFYVEMAIPLLFVALAGLVALAAELYSIPYRRYVPITRNLIYALAVTWILAKAWLPLGAATSMLVNFLFSAMIVGGLLLFFYGFSLVYPRLLAFFLKRKWIFLPIPVLLVVAGFSIMRNTGQEFMPKLNEGSFLLMPSSMMHSGIEENLAVLSHLDRAVAAIPEVKSVVGKIGRVESALDPAPLSMFENVINYHSEYITDRGGQPIRFKTNREGAFLLRGDAGNAVVSESDRLQIDRSKLIPDKHGSYFRQWREHILSPDDIWQEISRATKYPGVTSAPKLQPIETRLIMLQSGLRAPIGIKIKGHDLKDIEQFGFALEEHLKQVPGMNPDAVYAERIVGKPYLELALQRDQLAHWGLTVADVQAAIEVAIGGIPLTKTIEGREAYNVRIRYPAALREDPEALGDILVSTPSGSQLPLKQLVDLTYRQGPQSIKSEDGFLLGYVLMDKLDGFAETDVVEAAKHRLEELTAAGELVVPTGVSYAFAGNYELQVRANKRLALIIPIALALIFLLLYLEFRSVVIAAIIFAGIFVAFSGGFLMIGLYAQEWFLDMMWFGQNLRDVFHVEPINLSIAVWVGFLALFGIATDDGVLVASYLKQSNRRHRPTSVAEIRAAVMEAGTKRLRPALMTTATTMLALLPVLSAQGRGSEVMIPMAIPSFGGMAVAILTMFTVPILYSLWQEIVLRVKTKRTTDFSHS